MDCPLTDWTGALFSKFLVFPLLEINHGQCFFASPPHAASCVACRRGSAELSGRRCSAQELRYATLGLDTSDPHRHTGSIAVQQCYAEPLTSIADDGQVKPFLAEKVTVSSDGRTYTLKIRQGVKFHNGDVLTAEDVVANINRIREKIKGGWLVSSLKNVESLSVPEPGTVVIAFARPFAPSCRSWQSSGFFRRNPRAGTPRLRSRSARAPSASANGSRRSVWTLRLLLTTGKGLPKLAAVHFDLRDGTDKSLAIRSGDLDVAYVSKDAAEDLQRAGAAVIEGLKDSAWYFLSFNNRKPRKPFDDIRVRKALAHCIDKPGFMNFVGGSRAQTSNQFVGRTTSILTARSMRPMSSKARS